MGEILVGIMKMSVSRLYSLVMYASCSTLHYQPTFHKLSDLRLQQTFFIKNQHKVVGCQSSNQLDILVSISLYARRTDRSLSEGLTESEVVQVV